MDATFRLRKGVAYAGMAYTAIFLALCAGVASLFFLENPAEHGFKGEHSLAVMCGMGLATFGTMLLLSIYAWAAYYLESFRISGTTVSLRTMVQNLTFEAAELTSLRWRSHPYGGSILLRGPGFKGRLDLAGYRPDDRLRIVRGLRQIVPPIVQEGWEPFCYRVALPLRDDEITALPPPPSAHCCVVNRQRYDRMLAIALPLSVGAAIAAGVWLGLWQLLALPVATLAAWLFLRLHVPAEGRIEWRVTATDVGRTHLILWSVIIGANLMMIGIQVAGFDRKNACTAGCVALLVALPPLFYRMFRADKDRQARDVQLTELALAQWDAGEGADSLRGA